MHSAALQAGLYEESENLDVCLGAGLPALKDSIQGLGGSTARLFCMALREPKDLSSMGQTLTERVEELKEGLQRQLGVEPCEVLEKRLKAVQREAMELRAKREARGKEERRKAGQEGVWTDFDGFPMDFQWVLMEFQWIFHGLLVYFQWVF